MSRFSSIAASILTLALAASVTMLPLQNQTRRTKTAGGPVNATNDVLRRTGTASDTLPGSELWSVHGCPDIDF